MTPADDAELEQRAEEAVEYFFAHPYLELEPEFTALAFPGDEEEGEESFLAMLRETMPPPTDETTRTTEQAELDRLTARTLDAVADHPLNRWGLVPDSIRPHTLVSHMFLHVGWLHLIGNLLILYLAGPFIEDVWGRPLFAAFYLVGGLFAALAHIGADPGSTVPMIGASGAIAAVMGAFLVRYRQTKIRFFYIFGFFLRGTFAAPAWLMLPLWFGEQLFFASMTRDLDGAGVAHWAHIGGFAFGFGLAALLSWQRVEERYLDSAIESKVSRSVIDHPRVEEALAAHAAGESATAFEILRDETAVRPGDHDATLALWTVASDLGQRSVAVPAMLVAVAARMRAGETDEALHCWDELAEEAGALRVESGLAVRLAQALTDRRRPDAALVALRLALLGDGRPPSPALAIRIATLAGPMDPSLARGALRQALAGGQLDPQSRAEAERLLAELRPGGRPAVVAP